MNKVDFAYTLMASEFKGAPKKNIIKIQIRMALAKYKFKETKENLDEIGVTLITLKKKYNVSELNILSHACKNFDPEVSFRMQASISAVFLNKEKDSKKVG